LHWATLKRLFNEKKWSSSQALLQTCILKMSESDRLMTFHKFNSNAYVTARILFTNAKYGRWMGRPNNTRPPFTKIDLTQKF
jgi:hypothetical protein